MHGGVCRSSTVLLVHLGAFITKDGRLMYIFMQFWSPYFTIIFKKYGPFLPSAQP